MVDRIEKSCSKLISMDFEIGHEPGGLVGTIWGEYLP